MVKYNFSYRRVREFKGGVWVFEWGVGVGVEVGEGVGLSFLRGVEFYIDRLK